jgi:hypothetical protein
MHDAALTPTDTKEERSDAQKLHAVLDTLFDVFGEA